LAWDVELHDDFVPEYDELPEEVQDELLALIEVLERIGPQLGRGPASIRSTARVTPT
jgi:hypothetical protein